ncbi:cell wall metabolism sensor histidine kinase WalK [Demequina sp. NBRC 110055]|uniref:sensor histidine kinase n=1 Tax=Demequina sp. NBRC 110055 TaxID=1570344 RepID=UPI000A03196B|nr:HAMP domain-containing sensor histidine kinase [Demequina sp. NBRC 110055]
MTRGLRRTRRALSLRDRLFLGLAAVGLVATGVAVIVTFTTRSYLISQLDDRLDSYAGPAYLEEQQLRPLFEIEDEDGTRRTEAWRGWVDTDGVLHPVSSPTVEGASDASPVLTYGDLTTTNSHLTAESSDDSGDFRVLVRPFGGGWDITALPMDDVEAATARLVLIEGVGIALMLGGLGAVAWWVNRLGIGPMRRMVAASSQVAQGDLEVRLETGAGSVETDELAHSLNTMIGTLTASLEERERSEARLREFVADASHELRTPLTTVLGYAELHRRGALAGGDAQDDAWGRTEAEAARMRRLVEDMLTLAKYDAEPDIEMRDVALQTLATEIVADATVAYPATEFTFTGGHATVAADGDRLRQALLNVVANAAVHGGPHVTVAIPSGPDGARVTVHDDGPGMAPEVAARATERFVRGDSSRQRATGGAGLGLAITAAIVHAHGGSLDVVSAPGEGTTITISLPVAAPGSTAPRSGSDDSSATSPR